MGSGPWWFAGVVGLAGIVVGAILKWALDTLSERRKQRLEVSSRFIANVPWQSPPGKSYPLSLAMRARAMDELYGSS